MGEEGGLLRCPAVLEGRGDMWRVCKLEGMVMRIVREVRESWEMSEWLRAGDV